MREYVPSGGFFFPAAGQITFDDFYIAVIRLNRIPL
jgi:hypothetical protein